VNTEEARILREQVTAFNASEQQVQVTLITLPVGEYAVQVQAAAAHGALPDLLGFDGPNLYNYSWSGKLKPIGTRRRFRET
jgi:multiple sugar transport system substrate-binding protein